MKKNTLLLFFFECIYIHALSLLGFLFLESTSRFTSSYLRKDYLRVSCGMIKMILLVFIDLQIHQDVFF